MVERKRITTTAEMLSKMSLPEKIKQHSKDVLTTENNPEYLQLNYQVVGGPQSGEHVAIYPAKQEEFTYDFLFGGGSLGHPLKPTKIGEAVYKIAEELEAKVSFLDFTYARFDKQITTEAIEKAFGPVWEESERMKKSSNPNPS